MVHCAAVARRRAHFHQNAYNFAAALLQVPKFDASASDAANYGAIGAIVGHEVSHFVDTLGADYEADGRRRRWWTDDDMARYQAATEPLVRQFSGYRPFPDVAIDGKLALTENVADLGGLVAAFDAYRLHARRPRRTTRNTCVSRTGSSSSALRAAGAASTVTTH